jgi:hypothetical protein
VDFDVMPVPANDQSISAVRDVTDLGRGCGWWSKTFGAEDCRPHAMAWEGPGQGNEKEIHALGGLPPEDVSFAEAMNESRGVVGWWVQEEGFGDRIALLWQSDGGTTWSSTDLNGGISAACNFRLLEAHDINEEGWIVGAGDQDPSPGDEEIRAFLLIPFEDIPCPEDVNRDGVVDQTDLSLVINASNQAPVCEPGRICWEDVNGDCHVTNADVKLVMRAFGPCGGTGSGLTAFDTDIWMAVGGAAGIEEQTIGGENIAECLEEPTVAHRVVALCIILGE